MRFRLSEQIVGYSENVPTGLPVSPSEVPKLGSCPITPEKCGILPPTPSSLDEWGARRVRLVLATPKPKLRDSGNAFRNAPDMLSVLSQRVHVRFPFVGQGRRPLSGHRGLKHPAAASDRTQSTP